MLNIVAAAMDLLPLQAPSPPGAEPLIPDADPRNLPGTLGESVKTVIGTVKAALLAVAVVAGLIGTGFIMAGARGRSGLAVTGLEKVGYVVLGLAVMGALPSILELFV
ncbi:hypothetical protein [Pseudonocardia sp. ICBG601]|uniref:hypothetical protein n=1 Tax=Pseudonocardia sp. ICBG601 TaxID=2846759 RepID=UPI001CF70AE0|nr:hypothetical protein [Pseudonocardia sp. ICBG601]